MTSCYKDKTYINGIFDTQTKLNYEKNKTTGLYVHWCICDYGNLCADRFI